MKERRIKKREGKIRGSSLHPPFNPPL